MAIRTPSVIKHDQLEDARAVLDAFHVVKLATGVVDEVRRRVQQDIHGHRGRKNDPLYRIRNILRAGQENLTDRQRARFVAAFTSDERHVEVEVAWSCAQQVRAAYHQDSHAAGRTIAEKILNTFASCPIPEVTRLGRTLRQWRSEFLGYFDTDGASNGGTEAINGLIELHRRIARGFRNLDNYRLRMLLIAEACSYDPTLIGEEPCQGGPAVLGGDHSMGTVQLVRGVQPGRACARSSPI